MVCPKIAAFDVAGLTDAYTGAIRNMLGALFLKIIESFARSNECTSLWCMQDTHIVFLRYWVAWNREPEKDLLALPIHDFPSALRFPM